MKWRRVLSPSSLRSRTRQFALTAAGLLLTWLVLSRSLSFFIADTAPQFTLWLNPNHPVALMALAERARAKLLKLVRLDSDVTASVDKANTDSNEGEGTGMLATLPGNRSHVPVVETVREEIHALANRILASEPLEATAFRLLAEVTTDPTRIRPLMRKAIERSRREAHAAFWLVNDGYEQRNLADMVEKADVLLRTTPQLQSYVMRYLGEIAGDMEGREFLVRVLAKNPPWRAAFLNGLPRYAQGADTSLDLLLGLKKAGSMPTDAELAPYLNNLVSRKQPELAYAAWLQLVPSQKLGSIGLLNNATFTDTPSGLPFDWTFRRGGNASVDFIPFSDGPRSRAVQFSLGPGRVRFPEMSQILLLTPGHYRYAGTFQGRVTGKRGVHWELRCLGGRNSLANIAVVSSAAKGWQSFVLDAEIKESEDCRVQSLRLYHDARSPSEEVISGELSFRDLKLTRLDVSELRAHE
jgi:hypothetical protein